jgi:uncharacterized protein
MTGRIRRHACLVVAACCAAIAPAAPAFAQPRHRPLDCEHPPNAAHAAVCADPVLLALDQRFRLQYDTATGKVSGADRLTLETSLLGWLAQRESCAAAADVKACVRESYTAREKRLREEVAWATEAAAAAAAPKVASFRCPDGRTLTIETRQETNEARVSLGTRQWTLPRVISASGAHYADADVSLWNKSRSATFEEAGKALTCTRIEPAAPNAPTPPAPPKPPAPPR